MLSFDVSDRQINIVKGTNTAGKIKIDRSLAVPLPEDMIMNGEIIDLSGLADLLMTSLKSAQMMDKEAVITFSSSNIVFKELIVPKAKGYEFLTMVQNHMSQEMGISEEYSISYTIVGNASEENTNSVKVLATACPSVIVDTFRKLFGMLNIKLRSVNISCNSISRIIISDPSNMDKMPLLVCQIENNYLGMTLFENGQMAFARYVPIDPSEYETEDYLTEALNENIFRMEQFNKARGGSGLQNVILYGQIDDYMKIVDNLDAMDIKASVLPVPENITGFENFEFTVFANAIGALYKRNKQTERINLLEIDSATGKSSDGFNSLYLTAGIVVASTIAVIAAITIILSVKTGNVQKEIDDTNIKITECDKLIEKNKKLNQYYNSVETMQIYVDRLKGYLINAPLLKKKTFEQIDDAMNKTNSQIEYDKFSYARKDMYDGTVTIGDVHVTTKNEVPEYLHELRDLDYFANISCPGYDEDGENSENKVIKTLTFKLKGEGIEDPDAPKDSAGEENE